MATKLFFTSTVTDYSTGNNDAKLDTTASAWSELALSLTQGSSATSSTVPGVTGPTNGIEVLSGGGLPPRVWYSAPLDADITISGSITWNLRGAISAMTTNGAINGQLEVVDGATGTITLIDKTARTIEAGTSESAANFSETPASGVACKRGDRLRVRVFFDDSVDGNMAAGTCTFWYSGAAGATGDSYFTLTENLTFVSEPAATTIYPTDTASAVSTASVDREAWTSRGAGVQTDVTNTATGWTAPIQVTDTAGGTVVDWFTKQLAAFTLGGAVRVNARGLESNAAANATVRCEVARVASDGTSATVWGTAAFRNEFGTTESARSFLVSGDDLAVSDGQRLRIRFYIDDVGSAAMVTGHTVTLYYAGTSGGASGDTYLTFTQTLTEFTSGTSAAAQLASGTGAALVSAASIAVNTPLISATGSAYDATGRVSTDVIAPMAAGTGLANNATTLLASNASAGTATATGAAGNATAATVSTASAAAGTAIGTGAGSNASTLIHASANVATATGTASGAMGSDQASAIQASGSGLAYNATVQTAIAALAGAATGTGAAATAAASVAPNAGSAAGTGLANNATASTSSAVNAAAGVATGTGAAANATVSIASFVNVAAGSAAGSGAAADIDAAIAVNVGLAAGTGSASNATAAIAQTVSAGLATGTGSAANTSASIKPNAALGSGAGTASGAMGSDQASAIIATGSGAAYNATASTAAARNADAGTATGTGAAANVTATVAPNSGRGTGTGLANNAVGSTAKSASAGVATATGLARNVSASIKPTAGRAAGTGTASGAMGSDQASAIRATGTGAAYDATASVVAFKDAAAGTATGTGAAPDADTAIKVNAGSAAGSGAASNAFALVPGATAASAGSASGMGTAHNATADTGAVVVPTPIRRPFPAKRLRDFLAVDAWQAAATGTAHGATIRTTTSAGTARGTGTAHDAETTWNDDETALLVLMGDLDSPLDRLGYAPLSRITVRPWPQCPVRPPVASAHVPKALARRSFVLAKYIYEWKPTQYGNRLFRRPGSGAAPLRVRPAKPAKPAPEPESASSYQTKDQLIAAAEARGLDTSGTRAELLERLEGGPDEA